MKKFREWCNKNAGFLGFMCYCIAAIIFIVLLVETTRGYSSKKYYVSTQIKEVKINGIVVSNDTTYKIARLPKRKQ